MRMAIQGLLFFLTVYQGVGQTPVTVEAFMAATHVNHPTILLSQMNILQQQQLKKASFNLPNPEFAIETPAYDFGWSVSQNMEFPLVYISQTKLANQNILLAQKQLALTQSDLRIMVYTLYVELQFTLAKQREVKLQDSLFHTLSLANDDRYNAGDIGLLEKINANNAYQNKHNEWLQAQKDFENAQQQLLLVSGLKIDQPVPSDSLTKLEIPKGLFADTSYRPGNALIEYARQSSAVSFQNWKAEKLKWLPGLVVTYFDDAGKPSPITPTRVDVGITVPLWFWSYSGKIKAAEYQWKASQHALTGTQLNVNARWQQSITDFNKANAALIYYETSANPQAKTIIDAATRSYKAGEIGYLELIQNLNLAFETRLLYFNALKEYNNSILQLQNISGQ